MYLHVVEDFSWAVVPQFTSIRIREDSKLCESTLAGCDSSDLHSSAGGENLCAPRPSLCSQPILHLRSTSEQFVTHTCTSLDAVNRVAVSPHAYILQAAVASVCHVHATSAAISLLSNLIADSHSGIRVPAAVSLCERPLLSSQRVSTLLVSEPHEAKQQPS